jgi:hypothetical protein
MTNRPITRLQAFLGVLLACCLTALVTDVGTAIADEYGTQTAARVLRETSGPTLLRIGSWTDGQCPVRSGATVIGQACGTGAAPTNATYITQTADATLSAEQAMGALASGIVYNTTTTGVQSIATAGTDYCGPLQSCVVSGATTTTTTDVGGVEVATSGAAGVGYGACFPFKGEDASGGSDAMAGICSVWSDATAASEDSDFVIKLREGGAAAAERFRLLGTGELQIKGAASMLNLGGGSYLGSPAIYMGGAGGGIWGPSGRAIEILGYNSSVRLGDQANNSAALAVNYDNSSGGTMVNVTGSNVVLGGEVTTVSRVVNHVYLPTFAGVPTTAPTASHTGRVPIGINTSASPPALYVYDDSSWQAVGGGSGGTGWAVTEAAALATATGITASTAQVFYDPCTSKANWFLLSSSTGSMVMSTTLAGGVFHFETGAGANNNVYWALGLSGQQTVNVPTGGSKWGVSVRMAIPSTVTATSNDIFSVGDAIDTDFIRAGVIGSQSTTNYRVYGVVNSVTVTAASTVAIDTGFHTFRFYSDDTLSYFQVDGETPVSTGVDLSPTTAMNMLLWSHAGASAGVNKLLVSDVLIINPAN